MYNPFKNKYLAAGALALMISLSLNGIVVAQKPAPVRNKSGVTISPALQTITLAKDQPSARFELRITNNADREQRFELSLADFGSLDETGGVLFAGDASKKLDDKYGLKQWATVEKEQVTVAARQTAKVAVAITSEDDMKAGGHYGAVLVTPLSTGEDDKVQLNHVATSLIFLKKQGGESYKLNLQEYEVRSGLFRAPRGAAVAFQNAGNVHVIPRGIITIKDPRGRVVSQGTINSESAIVLPESQRRLDVPLQPVSRSLVPGMHTVSVSYRYDERAEFTTEESSFLYVNGLVVIAVLLVLGMLMLALLLRTRWLPVLRRGQ